MADPRHILIVEDEQPIANMLHDIFLERGYVLTHAHDGAEALEQVKSNPPDLILLDIMMPKMDGRELLDALKGTDYESIPVIILTNNDQMEVIAEMLGKGAHDYIVKADMTPHSIVRAVEQRLESLADEE